MAVTNEEILNKTGEVFDYTVGLRRKIHKYPELGMEEFKTATLIKEQLDIMGIPHRDEVGGTGVVGVIEGTKEGEGKVIGIRADMDALPIEEVGDREYKSQVAGVSHACGHDAHVAMLLGATRVLNDIKDEFAGKVVLIFQPAEEGPGGAKPMIEQGALKDPDVDAMIAIHVSSMTETGLVKICNGPVHAAQDQFEIDIKGTGGHAAYPHLSNDAIIMASRAVLALQTIVSRRINPLKPAVLTIGTVNGGYRHNVIADKVKLTGTLRFFDDELKLKIREWINEVLNGVTKPVGGDYEVKYIDGYPATVNDQDFYKDVMTWLTDLLGEEKVKEDETPTMGAEDFSYFANEVPSVFMGLGTGGKNKEYAKPHHHPEFDIDEDAFHEGIASFVKIAMEFLKK